MTNIGDIHYSLDKNDFYKILNNSSHSFIFYYFILIIISFLYLYSIRIQEYNDLDESNDVRRFFQSITYNSPFNILNICNSKNICKNLTNNKSLNNNHFIGLTSKSYLFIIISYIITLIIIVQFLLKNLLYSIYVKIIQLNKNNNPYNNPNCITKINDNPNNSIHINYVAIITLSIHFLIPFCIPYMLSIFKFDNYDIKHNIFIRYIILFLIFYPFIMILISNGVFYSKLNILSGLKKFIEIKDYTIISTITNSFNFKIIHIIPFIFIILIYSYYNIIYSEYNFSTKLYDRFFIYFIIIFIIFIFIPLILIFCILSILLSTNIYDLLVKYNYPCFIK